MGAVIAYARKHRNLCLMTGLWASLAVALLTCTGCVEMKQGYMAYDGEFRDSTGNKIYVTPGTLNELYEAEAESDETGKSSD